MRAFLSRHWYNVAVVGLFLTVLYCVLFLAGCAVIGRTGSVAAGAAAGAAAGSLAGPAGTIGGAAVGGALAHAIVESDASSDRAERLETRLGGTPRAEPAPSHLARYWLHYLVALYLLFRNRAHIMDAITGRSPRFDAVLRTLGFRTSKTPIPARKET